MSPHRVMAECLIVEMTYFGSLNLSHRHHAFRAYAVYSLTYLAHGKRTVKLVNLYEDKKLWPQGRSTSS